MDQGTKIWKFDHAKSKIEDLGTSASLNANGFDPSS